MAKFSIGEDDDDTPLANKRPRFAEPASQSQPRSQRFVPAQPLVVAEEDEDEELIAIEDVESDSQGSKEEEDDDEDEVEAEAVEEEDDDEEDEDVGSEDGGIQFTEVQPVSKGQNRPVAVRSLHIGLSNSTAAIKSSTTAPPVFLIHCLPLSSRYFISLYIRLYISLHLLVFGIQFSSVS
ncbi:unnamed protein product [Lactuca saligna]|uniref:Uncharacterized protein n=1 Tax=Lactuca saligna TaxID=75948 RepID=A0AA35ZQ14_LACSI|nr:unnamed protein product [Lactuca saligna]